MGFFKDYKEPKDDLKETFRQSGSESEDIDDMLEDDFNLEKYLQNNLDMDEDKTSDSLAEDAVGDEKDTVSDDDFLNNDLTVAFSETKGETVENDLAQGHIADSVGQKIPSEDVSLADNKKKVSRPAEHKEEKVSMNNDFSDIINEINATALQMDDKSSVESTDFGVSQGGTGSTAAAGDGDTTIICRGLNVSGDIESNGSIELMGTVNGDVTCAGKLSVSGTISGESKCSEFFANKANVTGNVDCSGPAKIAAGSIILGNLNAKSAVIAGAVKGDVDVHGPVIIDSTAIVLGDIKSESIQIMLGAAIEGHCSQCYAENNPVAFFENIK